MNENNFVHFSLQKRLRVGDREGGEGSTNSLRSFDILSLYGIFSQNIINMKS